MTSLERATNLKRIRAELQHEMIRGNPSPALVSHSKMIEEVINEAIDILFPTGIECEKCTAIIPTGWQFCRCERKKK